MNRYQPVEVMTPRARAYVTVTGFIHLLVGASAIVLQGTFTGPAFDVARSLFPIWIWGAAFVAVALYLARAASRGEEGPARTGMILSVFITSLLGATFALAWIDAGAAAGVVSPVGTILCVGHMAKDLVVCAQPLRAPFEPLIEQYERDNTLG